MPSRVRTSRSYMDSGEMERRYSEDMFDQAAAFLFLLLRKIGAGGISLLARYSHLLW